MSSLPIDAVLNDIRAALAQGPNAVLGAPPGAGKTTRVPLALIDAPWRGNGRILMLEPRRLAALAAAERLAAQLGEKPGGRVGYRIRGNSRPGTAIEVVTEGVLTRMLQSEPDLPGIAAVLFDEIHERSIHTDLGLALALEVQSSLRPDLRLLAMSATLDTSAISRLMGNAPVIEAQGRQFPVETIWLDRSWRSPGSRTRLEEATADLVRHAAEQAQQGDVLVFLPGAGEIHRTAARLAPLCPDIDILTLYGAMPFTEQRRVLSPSVDAPRRIVLSTALAETSLTVPRVQVVVDAGRARRAEVDPGTGLSRLVTHPVSRAEAEQRRGRAGRLAPGWCFRLWTKGEHGALPAYAPPEIATADLIGLALELSAWGTRDANELAFLTQPPEGRLAAARDLLANLGAIDRNGGVTAHGKHMATMPVHPRLAHMLCTAEVDGLGAEAAVLAALVSERDVLPEGMNAGADLVPRLHAVMTGKADTPAIGRVREEARRLNRSRPNPTRLTTHAARLLSLAFPDRVALRRPGEAPRFLLSGGRGAKMNPEDALSSQRLLICTDLDDGREATIRRALPLDEAELRAAHEDRISWQQTAVWSSRTRRVEARQREVFGALALQDESWRDAPADVLGAALADGICELGIAALPWDKRSISLRQRINWLRENGATHFPDCSDDTLMAEVNTWLAPYLAGLTQIGQITRENLHNALTGRIDHENMREIDRMAPARFTTPSGETASIRYDGEVPTLSIRVQALYGLDIHPIAGQPPQPLLVELLSPAARPVQLTRDLPGFWRSSYADVRKDMRARYPKHDWPEHPQTARPSHPRRRTT